MHPQNQAQNKAKLQLQLLNHRDQEVLMTVQPTVELQVAQMVQQLAIQQVAQMVQQLAIQQVVQMVQQPAIRQVAQMEQQPAIQQVVQMVQHQVIPETAQMAHKVRMMAEQTLTAELHTMRTESRYILMVRILMAIIRMVVKNGTEKGDQKLSQKT